MSASELLARWRVLGARQSDEVLELAPKVLKAGRLGDQEWAIREQLAVAALDLGQVKIATEQLVRLEKKFSGSPRVSLLLGLRMESLGDIDGARKVYEGLLAKDETNVSAHQRLIALSLSNPTAAINNLLKYLDTFYTDPAAWSLLAELYADQGLYAQSLTALGHLMLMQNWDSSAICRAGETAYTLGDYQLALKYFLRAIEMQTDPSDPKAKVTKTRSWWGLKLTTRRMLDKSLGDTPSAVTEQTTAAQFKALEQLSAETLLASSTGNKASLEAIRGVLSSSAVTVR